MGNHCTHSPEKGSIGGTRVDFVDSNEFQSILFLSRILAVSIFLTAQQYAKYRMRRSHDAVILILPSYLEYLYCLLFVNLVLGVLSFSIRSVRYNIFFIIFDITLSGFFTNSVFFFFLQTGAGKMDIIRAARAGFIVSCLVCIDVITGVVLREMGYQLAGFLVFLFASASYFVFSITLLLLPPHIVHRRHAFTPMGFSAALGGAWYVINNFLGYFGVGSSNCSFYGFIFLYSGTIQPLFILYAFYIDSNYWQGLLNKHANPLADTWGTLSMEVISSMQEAATTSIDNNRIHVPVLHFGQINFDYAVGFIRGGFSRVYFGQFIHYRVAIKMLFVMELTAETVESFLEEARVLMDLQHEHVVTCYGITLLPPAFGVVMEYCPNGSLYSYLYEKDSHSSNSFLSRLSLSSLRPSNSTGSLYDLEFRSTNAFSANSFNYTMMVAAASALAFIHDKGYMHCDMKSLNYLVTSDFSLKISDLGEARRTNAQLEAIPIPAIHWCPPEVLMPEREERTFTQASDVFGLAMILSEILLHELPLEIAMGFMKNDYNNWLQLIQSGKRPLLPAYLPVEVTRIIEAAWSCDPSERPKASRIHDTLRKHLVTT